MKQGSLGVVFIGLRALFQGIILCSLVIFLTGTLAAFIGDFCNWNSFRLSILGISIYRFQAGSNGSFFGEFRDGVFLIPIVFGLVYSYFVSYKRDSKR